PSRVPAPPGVVRVDNLSPMILTSDPGPVGAPTSKDAAGFLAPSAVRFTGAAGERTEAPLPAPEGGRTPIGRQIASGDVLRWFVHPQLDAQQSWGATWVALDLLLDDGRRLSDHARPGQGPHPPPVQVERRADRSRRRRRPPVPRGAAGPRRARRSGRGPARRGRGLPAGRPRAHRLGRRPLPRAASRGPAAVGPGGL